MSNFLPSSLFPVGRSDRVFCCSTITYSTDFESNFYHDRVHLILFTQEHPDGILIYFDIRLSCYGLLDHRKVASTS